VRLVLGKTSYPKVRGGEAVAACVSATEKAGGGEAAEAPSAASEFFPGHRPSGGWTRSRRPRTALQGLSKQGTRYGLQAMQGVRSMAGKKRPRRRR
jgi:hypothetical protein